ncbi:protein serine/threonine phosphatase 2C [Mycena belliarum]|uniref:Protein serine/threonine phosphatase 2C n=1 Tax=Mycena belliarum TaxID=1033014 RepID=A0AAD6XJK6_9AGAR|nr:protein serine/threonine phosphatase 2C [Mycena belliae]
MESLQQVRQRFLDTCISRITPGGVHTVAFQPKQTRRSEDFVAIEQWQIHGHHWTFLAVFDGHGGVDTSRYAADVLPRRIQTALTALISTSESATVNASAVQSISDMLTQQIKTFDRAIGKAVKRLCENPDDLDDTSAQAIVDANFEVLARAFYGSTLAAALINENGQLWVASVGDSTHCSAVSYLLPDGTRDGKRLSKMHNPTVPSEYVRISFRHPTSEVEDLFRDDRVLGSISMTRALGDFSFKWPKAFSERLLFKLPSTFDSEFPDKIRKFNKTPPYLTATPSVEYFDMTSSDTQDSKPILLLFSDGVDNIVKGEWVFHQDSPRSDEPSSVAGALLSDKISEHVQSVLGHHPQPRWLGENGNMATELLGNLLAGTKVQSFVDALNPLLLEDPDKIYIDDTTLIVFPLSSLKPRTSS